MNSLYADPIFGIHETVWSAREMFRAFVVALRKLVAEA